MAVNTELTFRTAGANSPPDAQDGAPERSITQAVVRRLAGHVVGERWTPRQLESHPPRNAAPTVEASEILMRDDSRLDHSLAVGNDR